MLVAGRWRRVIYKRFRVTKWHDPFTALARPSPALRSWIHGQGLRERCLPTARPLAVFHRRRCGLHYEGYLLTEEIPDAADLHSFVKSMEHLPTSERLCNIRQRIDQIARLVSELHRRQISQRDLKAANILLTTDAAWLIDLVGLKCARRLSIGQRTQNLARLNASFIEGSSITRTDRLRFLRVYLQWGLVGKGGWKTWWRDIELATNRKIAKNQRTGRPLA
jgi:hypothetical protein